MRAAFHATCSSFPQTANPGYGPVGLVGSPHLSGVLPCSCSGGKYVYLVELWSLSETLHLHGKHSMNSGPCLWSYIYSHVNSHGEWTGGHFNLYGHNTPVAKIMNVHKFILFMFFPQMGCVVDPVMVPQPLCISDCLWGTGIPCTLWLSTGHI